MHNGFVVYPKLFLLVQVGFSMALMSLELLFLTSLFQTKNDQLRLLAQGTYISQLFRELIKGK